MKKLFVLTVSLLLAGCAQTTPMVVGPEHTASPEATVAPLPAPSGTLALSDAADSTATPPATPPAHAGHDMGHAGGHGSHASPMPASMASQPTTQRATAAMYVCPMHPEVVSNQPGICPKCKMKLVKKGGGR
jgi:hypothetical protein